jgi:hypothetical protein
MMRVCADCGQRYDDGRRLTCCPHSPLMSDEDLAQKDLAMGLIGKTIRFNHLTEAGPDCRVTSIGWNGMVTIEGWAGEFAPHVFTIVEAPPPRSSA